MRRIPWWASLRLRIALAVAATSLIVSGIVGGIIAQQSADDARTSLRDQALGRLTAASEGYRIDGRLRFDASLDPHLPPPLLVGGMAVGQRRSLFDGDWMWAAERIAEGKTLTVRLPADPLWDKDAERVQSLGLAGLASVVTSTLLGWAAATQVSRRLRRAASSASAIAADNRTGPGEPVEAAAGRVAPGEAPTRIHEGGRDEVAALTAAVDAMADALRARIEVEKAFTADVAHELRTPLTGLVSAAELLPDDDEAALLVRRQVARLRRLVEDLLEVSRLDHGAEETQTQEVDLADATRAALGGLTNVPGAPDVEADLPAQGARVLLDPRRFERVLANLLTNAARHGGGACRVAVAGPVVTLRDDGPGYPEEVVVGGPRRFHGSGKSKGAGLGLTIASKQAASMDAVLVFDNPSEGGARATLTFPAARG